MLLTVLPSCSGGGSFRETARIQKRLFSEGNISKSERFKRLQSKRLSHNQRMFDVVPARRNSTACFETSEDNRCFFTFDGSRGHFP